MSTVTLHPFGSGPTRNRAIAPTATPVESAPRLKIRKQAAIEGRTVSNMIQRLVELAFAKKGR